LIVDGNIKEEKGPESYDGIRDFGLTKVSFSQELRTLRVLLQGCRGGL
jgi:hypothetical protein